MQKQTKTYYGPYELTDHLRLQFVVIRSEGRTSAKRRLVSVHVFTRSVQLATRRHKRSDRDRSPDPQKCWAPPMARKPGVLRGHQKGAGFCNLIDWWCPLDTTQ